MRSRSVGTREPAGWRCFITRPNGPTPRWTAILDETRAQAAETGLDLDIMAACEGLDVDLDHRGKL
jgi:hypothetical protein